jgi:hypothetical protein
MAPEGETAAGIGSVEGVLNYIVPEGGKPVTYISEAGAEKTRRQGRYEKHAVAIRDGRALANELSLDRQGFMLAHTLTAVSDFYDADEVRRVYYPEVEKLVRSITGAAKVVVFDHNVRSSDDATQAARGVREPVRVVHNDYTPRSGPQRVRDLIGGTEAEALIKHRFAVINVWRTIKGPVRRMPLAVCDAASIAPADLVATDLKYRERTGEVYQTTFNPDHRWYYFPELSPDEAILIKCYDSAEDGRARFSCHTAFDDPTTPVDADARESVEARTLVFFAPESDAA